jgi:hypothetical protein
MRATGVTGRMIFSLFDLWSCPLVFPLRSTKRSVVRVLGPLMILCVSATSVVAEGTDPSASSAHLWRHITSEAEKLGLPTTFLKAVPSDFVHFEFDDLQAFAAEYHLGEHRMVLNRTLTFNVAGRTLRPLARLTHAEMDTLYHELFHAYMDYLMSREAPGQSDPLLMYAREQQRCRYGAVLITPVVQRKFEIEERFLSEHESWEALNEAWAVFVGWTVWSQLELRQGRNRSLQRPGKDRDAWLRRLEEADREGKFRGYYEPQDPAERSVTRKRFLAPQSRLSKEEIERLMAGPLEFSPDVVKQAIRALTPTQTTLPPYTSC